MSQNYYLKNTLKNQKGSVLVGVIALTIILSIAAITYAALVRNGGTNETTAYNDTRALLTATQGALVADNWLSNVSNWIYVKNHGACTLSVPSVYEDISCRVILTYSNNNSTKEPWITAVSEAVDNLLPYTKKVELKIPGKFDESFALYVGDAGNFTAGGLYHRGLIVGPAHFNSPIMINHNAFRISSSTAELYTGFRFQGGDVTVWDNGRTAQLNKNTWWTGILGGDNNYTTGVAVGKNAGSTTVSPTGIDLDRVFRSNFSAGADQCIISFDANKVKSENRLNFGNNHVTGATDATIEFGYGVVNNDNTKGCTGSGCAYYDFKIGTGTTQRRFYNPDDPTVIYARSVSATGVTTPYNLKVTGSTNSYTNGKLRGNVTVVTDSGKNITIDVSNGYQSYPLTKKLEVPSASGTKDDIYANILEYNGTTLAPKDEGFRTGGGIDFVAADAKNIFSFYSGKNVIIDVGSKTSGNVYITGQMFATKDAYGTFEMKTTGTTTKDIKLQVVGTSAMNKWWDIAQENYTNAQKGALRTYFDKRTEKDAEDTTIVRPLMGPGLRYLRINSRGDTLTYVGRGAAGSGDYVWSEKNTAK